MAIAVIPFYAFFSIVLAVWYGMGGGKQAGLPDNPFAVSFLYALLTVVAVVLPFRKCEGSVRMNATWALTTPWTLLPILALGQEEFGTMLLWSILTVFLMFFFKEIAEKCVFKCA